MQISLDFLHIIYYIVSVMSNEAHHENERKNMVQSWRDFLHVLLDPTLEEALLVAVNGAIFTFGVMAFFYAWLNFNLFAGIVIAVTMYFVAVIINQHIENFFERMEIQ